MKSSMANNPKGIGQIGALVTIPFVLAVPPFVGGFIGKWLDKYFDTSPYFMYAFLLIGLLAGVFECYRIIKEFGT